MGIFDFFKRKAGDPADRPAAGAPGGDGAGGQQPQPAATPAPEPGGASATGAAAETPPVAPVGSAPKAAASSPTTPPAGPAAAATIEAMDAFGRRVQLPREQYRTQVLPELVKAHGSDADRLAAVILQALRDGCAADVLAAANRLTVIDRDPERSLSILAAVQRDAGELDSAAATLRELQQKRPQSPTARVGLAMLAERSGDLERCEALLWEALQIDPNHPDGLHGFLQVRHRVVGDDGHAAEIERVIALPGSWRPQLWLARWHLQHGRSDAAIAIYRDVLQRAGDQSDALLMASADLVQAQRHDLVAELVAPRYQVARMHPHIGLALLHHYLQTRQHAPGDHLLHQLHLYFGQMLGDQLQPFTAEFDRLRLSMLPPPAPPPAQPRIGLYRLEKPIWFAGLDDPDWLLPKKAKDSRQVLCLALAVDAAAGVPAGREEEVGRLTRSLPLFLGEQIWAHSPQRGVAALPLAEHGGWAVMGRPWPEEQLAAQLPPAEQASTILVSGVLRLDGEQRRIDLWAYDCASKQRIGHAAAEGGPDRFGAMAQQLFAELLPAIGGPAGRKAAVGDDLFWARYLDGLGQHAALVVTQAGGMPKDRLFGVRYILQWLQTLPLQEARWQPAWWLFASGLCVDQQLGSSLHKEFGRTLGELFRQAPAAMPFARLAVKPLQAVGLEGFWQMRRAEIVAAAANQPEYLAWLQRVETKRPAG